MWVSNSKILQDKFKQDGRNASHDSESEKLLGYQYFPTRDTISLAFPKIENKVISKRTILSNVSKFFDPLGLILPCLVYKLNKGK